MKKIITLYIPVLLSMQLISAQSIQLISAQKTNNNLSPQALHDFYLQKSKTKTISGVVLLVMGIAMANEQIKLNVSRPSLPHPFSGGNDPNITNKKLWLLKFGKAMTLASIPYFISAFKYKDRAKLILK